jgi:hypothetical protein
MIFFRQKADSVKCISENQKYFGFWNLDFRLLLFIDPAENVDSMNLSNQKTKIKIQKS